MSSLEDVLQQRLQQRKQQQRYRTRMTLNSAQSAHIGVDTGRVTNFCSNDYLGLANHRAIAQAMQDASAQFGVGSGASHLVCGHSEHHQRLERELADFTGRQRALLFSTGFMANIGVISALMTRGDAIFQDKLNHASLIDGAIQSRASHHRYRHKDVTHLDELMRKSTSEHKLVVSDGVFSMDGDIAPLNDLAQCCAEHGAWLMIDDAHGIGVLGDEGKGALDDCKLSEQQVPILIGTFGKALGTFGAFVAGSDALIENLIQFARSYIYTTAMPPALAHASSVALQIQREESWRRDKLKANIALFKQACTRRGIGLMPSISPIQPVPLGDDASALAVSEALRHRDFLVTAIRPPTVPEGTSRLRITLSAAHEESDILALVDALVYALDQAKVQTPAASSNMGVEDGDS